LIVIQDDHFDNVCWDH